MVTILGEIFIKAYIIEKRAHMHLIEKTILSVNLD